jgi:biotin operon repressor
MDQVEHSGAPKEKVKLPAPCAQRKRNKTKKDRLISLLSKPKGAQVSVLCKALGWQKHTVRAAMSGLRKQGMAIETSRSVNDVEAIYTLRSQPEVNAPS